VSDEPAREDPPTSADGGARAGSETGASGGAADGVRGPPPAEAGPPHADAAGARNGGRRTAVVTTGDSTVIARTVARVAVPLVFLVAVSLTLRGHNLPGGGFIGGVMTAIAVVLLYVVFDLEFVRTRLVPGGRTGVTRTMFAVGLGVALVSGLVPVAFGDGFLTQGYVILPEPLPGPFFHEFEVASALAFDVGVFLVVVGGLLTIVREVGAE